MSSRNAIRMELEAITLACRPQEHIEDSATWQGVVLRALSAYDQAAVLWALRAWPERSQWWPTVHELCQLVGERVQQTQARALPSPRTRSEGDDRGDALSKLRGTPAFAEFLRNAGRALGERPWLSNPACVPWPAKLHGLSRDGVVQAFEALPRMDDFEFRDHVERLRSQAWRPQSQPLSDATTHAPEKVEA